MFLSFVVIARGLLAFIFALSGAAKLADIPDARKAIADFGIPAWLARRIAPALPACEIAVAALLVPALTAWWAGMAGLVLLLVFSAAIGINLMLGRRPDCRCFGQVHSRPIGWSTLARNAALMGCAGIIVWGGPSGQVSFAAWLTGLTPSQAILTVAAVLFAGFGVQTWLILHLLRQNGRLMLRMDALENRSHPLQAPSPGLPIGAQAPAFELPTLDGEMVSLDAMRGDGKPVLLIFAGPNCGACVALMPEISRWQREYVDKLRIVVVSEGIATANRAQFKRHGLKNLVLQQAREVAEAYQVSGTPAAVVIRPDGSVGSHVMMGPQAITDLVRPAHVLKLAGMMELKAVKPVASRVGR